MPNKIAPRRSFTPNSVPIPSTDISQAGEMLVNWADARLFTKDNAGNLITINLGGGGSSSASIFEAATVAGFPATGSAGVLYIATDSSRFYRWDSSAVYIEIGPE